MTLRTSSWSQLAPAPEPSEAPPRRSYAPMPARRSSVPEPWPLGPYFGAYQEQAARIAEAPARGRIRGMFFSEVQRLAPGLPTHARARYLPFSMYPLRMFMQLLLDAAQSNWPFRAPEEGLRELGRSAFGVFASSMAGMSLLSGASDRCEDLVALAPKAYALLMSPGSAELSRSEPGSAVLQLRDVWTFPESYGHGGWLGALEGLGLTARIEVIRHSWSSVDLHLTWSTRK